MADIEKEIIKEEKKVEKFFHKKENVWMSISIILLVALVISLGFNYSCKGISGNVISEDAAGEKAVDFIKNSFGADVSTFDNVTDLGYIYIMNVPYQGQDIPVYVTKDGKYFISSAIDMEAASATPSAPTTPTPTEVVKSDKPIVDGYFFSYCPYGTQFEKAMIPVYNLLKNKADFNIVFIGAMHGEYEKIESLRQICVQKEYGKDKLWAYFEKFLASTDIGSCNGGASCLAPYLTAIMKNLSIDESKIETCMANDAEALYNADIQKAGSLGISGSPTFVINGAQVQVARSPEAIKTAICNAFTTAPSECSQTLSSTAASPGFGSGAGSASSAIC
jgi:protein-disulfide isomerase